MAIQVLEKIYEGSQLTTVKANVIYFRLPCDCDISEIRLIGTGFNSGLGEWLFNVSVDGANLFAGSGRITFNSADNDVTKTGLSVSGLQGDIVVLNLESSGTGIIQSPITLLVTIDDGLSSGGGGTEYLPDIPPSSPHAFDDEFTAGSLDAKWTQYGASDLTNNFSNGSYVMRRLSNSNGLSGIYQAIPSGAWDWITKLIVPQGVPSGSAGFYLTIFDNAASTATELIAASLDVLTGTGVRVLGIDAYLDRATLDSELDPGVVHAQNTEASMPFSAVYLRVNRNVNAYDFYWSSNGVVWILGNSGIGDITTVFDPSHIGLTVKNTAPGTRDIAYVDWTRIYTALPVFMGG